MTTTQKFGFSVSRSQTIYLHEGMVHERVARALFDFVPQEEGELGFHRGDLIRLTDSTNSDWWAGTLADQEGLFPATYVQEIKGSQREI